MKDYLALWAQRLMSDKSLVLKKAIAVVGERDAHLGPRWQFAKIWLTAYPAPAFEVVDGVPDGEILHRLGYFEFAIFGVLDVLMVAKPSPLYTVRIVLERAEHHPVDSSPAAFLHAGRDAGRKIINSMDWLWS